LTPKRSPNKYYLVSEMLVPTKQEGGVVWRVYSCTILFVKMFRHTTVPL
jgi:hypothetical protein